MTLQEFKSDPYWRMVFDLAFGIGLRTPQPDVDDYTGPISNVVEVMAYNRPEDAGGFAYAAVRLSDAPCQYVLIWAIPAAKRGNVEWFGRPHQSIAADVRRAPSCPLCESHLITEYKNTPFVLTTVRKCLRCNYNSTTLEPRRR